ncbi:MAG: hypothetical protein Q4D05_08420 [Acinetobacter sp.]|nr:hypothetical protein [Acinetobacter sp.]
MAEIRKLNAEVAKLEKETKYYPWVVVVSASVAATITTLFALLQWVFKPLN